MHFSPCTSTARHPYRFSQSYTIFVHSTFVTNIQAASVRATRYMCVPIDGDVCFAEPGRKLKGCAPSSLDKERGKKRLHLLVYYLAFTNTEAEQQIFFINHTTHLEKFAWDL
ncbi:hypothetical protein KP509_07G037300 [Ceratopteris richardii]|uniref:Uncharacterized protein n=2 Tax=Ceratopteris richardii TaxID=49495 RepID=A0A8T2UG16_CERRI|nr:hypothetical protein KP509_07G037300 [Ceratopteris richardii]